MITTFSSQFSKQVLVALFVPALFACTDNNKTSRIQDAQVDKGIEGVQEVYISDVFDGKGDFDETFEPFSLLQERYCKLAGEVFCEAAQKCNCDLWDGFPSKTACTSALEEKCARRISFIAEGIEAGSLALQEDRLEACADIIQKASLSCEVPNPLALTSACSDIVVEKVALGSPCSFEGVMCADGDGLCFSGSCKPLPDLGEGCESLCKRGAVCLEGVCKQIEGEGGSCSKDIECEMGLVCINGRCEQVPDKGTDCETNDDCGYGEICNNKRCEPGPSSCSFAPDTCGNRTTCLYNVERRCVPKGGVGAPCEGAEQCEVGLVCSEGFCAEAPKEGEPCKDGIYCAIGLACDLHTATCAPLPDYGEPCALGPFGPFVCKEGLACKNGVCVEPPGLGLECASDAVCAEGLVCDFRPDGSFCDNPHLLDEPCQADRTCAQGLFCDFTVGKCAKKRTEGAGCAMGNECADGLTCFPDKDLGFTCHKIPAVSEPCYDTCGEGLFCKNVSAEGICLPGICSLFLL